MKSTAKAALAAACVASTGLGCGPAEQGAASQSESEQAPVGHVSQGATFIETWGGHTYHFVTDWKTWDAAAQSCSSLGSSFALVTINDASENDWLRQRIAFHSAGTAKNWHIGLNDRDVENTFVWQSGESATYLNWKSPPDNWQDREDCAMMYYLPPGSANETWSGKWNDAPCSGANFYVCEQHTTQLPAACGNFRLDAGEQCDDGNFANGDGCSFLCKSENRGLATSETHSLIARSNAVYSSGNNS